MLCRIADSERENATTEDPVKSAFRVTVAPSIKSVILFVLRETAMPSNLKLASRANWLKLLFIASDDGIAVVAHRPATDEETSEILNPLSAPVSSLDTINE